MKTLLTLTLSATLACTAFAMEEGTTTDADARREAARELMLLMNMDEMFDDSMDSYYDWARQQTIATMEGASDEDIGEAMEALTMSFDKSREYFAWERLSPMFTDIYMEVFTASELRGLIVFYQSDIGKVFVEKQPQLMEATMQKMQGLMQEMMMDLQRDMEAMMEERAAARESVESGSSDE